jgi:ferredoxin-NADP reductase
VQRHDAGHGASAAIHASFTLGMRLACSQPRNHFELHADARPALLIAGGIGITPLAAMARCLAAEGGRPFALHFAARSTADMPLSAELRHLLGARLHTFAGDRGERLNVRALLRTALRDTVVYVCGPARLIDAVRTAARELGWSATRVRSEAFVAPAASGNAPVRVELRRSGRTIDVGPSQSILDAVEAAGIAVPWSCRTGTCGTCATKVLSGTPLHRDHALTPAERERAALMCICVSRSQTSTLAIDL